MKIVLRKENTAAIFGNERVCVSQLAARIVQLEAGPAREPNRGDAAVIEGGGEFIEARDAFSAGRNQVVNGDVKDEGSLAQKVLRYASFHLSGDCGKPRSGWKKRLARLTKGPPNGKRAGIPARFAASLAEMAKVAVYI
jgi:hypothetical protein